MDGDGYYNDVDCNDYYSDINPGVTEICGNNIDDNCNGQIDENCGTFQIYDFLIFLISPPKKIHNKISRILI